MLSFAFLKIKQSHNELKIFTKRNFCEKNTAQCLQYEKWDLVYTQGTQKGFMWFQGLVDLFLNKCFQKQIYTNTYKN